MLGIMSSNLLFDQNLAQAALTQGPVGCAVALAQVEVPADDFFVLFLFYICLFEFNCFREME